MSPQTALQLTHANHRISTPNALCQRRNEQLIQQYDTYIKWILRRVYTHERGSESNLRELYEDLYHYGIIGLLRAAQTFDPNQNTHFSTWAFYSIRTSITGGYRKLITYEGNGTDWHQSTYPNPSYRGGRAQKPLGTRPPTPEEVENRFSEKYLERNLHPGRRIWHQQILNQASCNLSSFEKEILNDYFLHELTMKQIAAKQRKSVSYISRKITLAMEQLREKITLHQGKEVATDLFASTL